jgi:hypothetical protein
MDIDHRYVKAETFMFRLDLPHPQVVMRYYYEALRDNFDAGVLAGYSAEFIQQCVCVFVKCVACICQTRTMSARNHALTRLHNHESYEYRATKGYPQNCRSILLECLLLKYVLHGEIF